MMGTMSRTKGSRTTPLAGEVQAQLDDESYFSWDTNKGIGRNVLDKTYNPLRSRLMGGRNKNPEICPPFTVYLYDSC